MYGLSELHKAHHISHPQDPQDMATLQYGDTHDRYHSAAMQPRSQPVDEHALNMELADHFSPYMSPSNSYHPDVYTVQSAVHPGDIYEQPLDSQYIGQSESWPSYDIFDGRQNYPSQVVTRQAEPTQMSYTPSPQLSAHYTVGYPSTRPVMTRHPSSQRVWHSDHGHDTHHDGNNQRATASSLQGTPLTTFPMLPILMGGNPTSSNSLASRGEKKDTTSLPEQPDPYASRFLQEQLGEEKWEIFTSRLAENRKNGSRSRMKVAIAAAMESGVADYTDFGGASAIDFLVKVEVVKRVLRTYVPHPYNPQKSMSHPYSSSPKGHVVISRSSVLTLSGWSNTQFAYWARRAEGVSVLCNRDRRLRTVAKALERRLKEVGVFECSPLLPDSPRQEPAKSSTSTPRDAASDSSSGQDVKDEPADERMLIDEIELMDNPERWVKTFVTGKGLDVIIDDVKKRCGVSQFLRGKHSSLDPFGASLDNDETGRSASGESSQVFMPTFQAESYIHERPSGTAIRDTPGGSVQDKSPSPDMFLDSSPEVPVATTKRKASSTSFLSEPHMPTLSVTSTSLDEPCPVASRVSSEQSNGGLAIPRPSPAFSFSDSSLSVSPLSPITPLSVSVSSSSSSALDIPRRSHSLRSQRSLQSSPYNSPPDALCSKLNMRNMHLGGHNASGMGHTINNTYTHSQPVTPMSPTGIPRPNLPDNYSNRIARSVPLSRHIDVEEFELAQGRFAPPSFSLVPSFPERKYKKQKLVDESRSEAPTPKRSASSSGEASGPQRHQEPGQVEGSHFPGLYNMSAVSSRAGSGSSSPASWHGHSITPA